MTGAKARHSIGVKVLVLIVLFSSMVTAVSTLLQLYLDYRHDVQGIQYRLDEIERTSLASLAAALWNVDQDQLRTQLGGLMRLPDMEWLELREDGAVAQPLVVAAGRRTGGPVLAREYPLVRETAGAPRRIGTLKAEASLAAVYERLVEKAVVILVAQGVKTFLVSLFTLAIVYHLITRHLMGIAGYAAAFDIRRPGPPLALDRKAPPRDDELEMVVAAFNAMRLDLQSAYEQLRAANAAQGRDIEERKRRARMMRRVVARLTRTNRELERFAYIASHDLREPVRSMGTYAQLIAKRYGERLDDEGREFLAYMTRGAERIVDMLNDLIAYTRLPERPAREVVSVEAAVRRALANLDETIHAAEAEIVVDPLPELPADPVLLGRLFQNLLDNAVKFRRLEARPRVRVSAELVDGVWRFAVADDGIGIPATEQDVFEVFRRLHPSYPGTGIGLAICKRIVELHDGTIWIESRPEQGTTVFFTLGDEPEG